MMEKRLCRGRVLWNPSFSAVYNRFPGDSSGGVWEKVANLQQYAIMKKSFCVSEDDSVRKRRKERRS